MLNSYYKFHEFKKKIFEKYPSAASIGSLGIIILWVLVFKSIILSANNIPTGSMIPTLKIGDFLFVNRMRYGIHLPFTDINLFQYERPTRGDIVVFTPPASAELDGKTLVKRVIGVPGDEIIVNDDEIFASGVKYPVVEFEDRTILNDLDYPGINKFFTADDLLLFKERVLDPETSEVMVEHYMLKHTFYKQSMLSNPGKTFVIPEGKYMVMGDNRDDSDDSRRWGFVDARDIHGKVFLIYFSVNWGSRFFENEDGMNPFTNLARLFRGQLDHVSVRWNRIGNRIY